MQSGYIGAAGSSGVSGVTLTLTAAAPPAGGNGGAVRRNVLHKSCKSTRHDSPEARLPQTTMVPNAMRSTCTAKSVPINHTRGLACMLLFHEEITAAAMP